MENNKLINIFEKLNIENREDLLNKVVYLYEYTFKDMNILMKRDTALEMVKKYDRKLKHVDDLERLFLGIYLYLTLEVLKKYNVIMIKNSIEKSLMQINILSKDFLATQIALINNLLKNESLPTLIERPYVMIEDESNLIFLIMNNYKEELKKFFKANINDVSKNVFKNPNNFDYKENKNYISKEELLVEYWIVDIYKFVDRELSILIDSSKFSEEEKDLFDNNSLVMLNEVEDIIDACNLKEYSLNFVKSISTKNIKNLKYMINYICKLNENVLRESLSIVKNSI